MKVVSLEEALKKASGKIGNHDDYDEERKTLSGFSFSARVQLAKEFYREFHRNKCPVPYDHKGEDMPLMREVFRQVKELRERKMLEKTIVEKIKKYLLSLPRCNVMKVHGTQFTTGQPDLIGCIDGQMICLEVKQPGKHATPLQEKRLREWAGSGAIVGVVCSVDEVKEVLGR